jgi:hypothetical protein
VVRYRTRRYDRIAALFRFNIGFSRPDRDLVSRRVFVDTAGKKLQETAQKHLCRTRIESVEMTNANV